MSKKNELELNYYLVAFVDLLGQQDIMNELPSTLHALRDEEAREVSRIINKIFGSVMKFQDGFITFIETHNNNSMKSPLRKNFGSTEIKFQRFSDGLVVFLSLKTREINALPLEGILPILIACGGMFLISLSEGQPIRGGLDVGLGVELNENEIYGPVVSKAYNLESKIAAYPRIVIGNEFVKYLDTHAMTSKNESDPQETFRVDLAKMCMSLIAIDDDGHPFVDYLGEGFKKHVLPEYDKHIRKANAYIVEQSEKWKKEKNSKLAFRYSLLMNYFEERLNSSG